MEQTLVERLRQSQVVQQTEQQSDLLRRKQAVEKPATEETPTLSRTKAAAEMARARLDNLISYGDLVQQLLNVVESERQLWESRLAIAHVAEPAKAREAYERFKPLFESFHASESICVSRPESYPGRSANSRIDCAIRRSSIVRR